MSTEELESRMKQIIDDYSPILEGVTVEELKEKVKESRNKIQIKIYNKKIAQHRPLHLKNATNGEDVPVGE